MPKITPKLLLASVLLITSQACAPAAPTLDQAAIDTAVAQTFEAALTLTAQPGIPVTGRESPTPTAIASATPFPTFTPVILGPPQIRVSVPTNCRVGPGQVYDRVGALLVGEVAEVVGRSANGNYWIIRNPDRPGETCWLWGEFATVTGLTSVLPAFTPPPTPTPSPTPLPSATPTRTPTPVPSNTPTATSMPVPGFAASYSNMESCTGTGSWVDIQLQNSGGVTFQSIAMTVRDTVDNTVLALYSDDFTNRNGCSVTETRDNLPPGVTLLVSSPVFGYDPSRRGLQVTITLCSNPGQSGTCTTQVINFTP